MDISYYKCLLRKMNLFRPKNKLGCAAVPDRVGRGEKEAVDGGSRQKKVKPKKVKNVNLNGQKAQEYEEM